MINKLGRIKFRLERIAQIQANRLRIGFDDIAVKKVPNDLPEEWMQSFHSLKEFGYAKLPSKLSINTTHWREKDYLAEGNHFIIPTKDLPQPNIHGMSITNVDINSAALVNDVLTQNLSNLIAAYYGRQFWLRNSPVLRWDSKAHREQEFDQGLFHLDWVERQLSAIILLTDIDETNTHTEIIPHTSKKSWLFQTDQRIDKNFIQRAENFKSKYGSVRLTGNAGDMFLIDAGNGLHRGVFGKDRWMLHLNFSQFRRYAEFDNDWELSNKSLLLDRPPSRDNMQTFASNGWGDAFKYINAASS